MALIDHAQQIGEAVSAALDGMATHASGALGRVRIGTGATACIYLLLGVIWALVYVFINQVMPGSFSGRITGTVFNQLQDFLYYSFVTLTTLGYGDIVPVRAGARALATFEAIVGQFYIAILVAGLVAAYITRRQQTVNGAPHDEPDGPMS